MSNVRYITELSCHVMIFPHGAWREHCYCVHRGECSIRIRPPRSIHIQNAAHQGAAFFCILISLTVSEGNPDTKHCLTLLASVFRVLPPTLEPCSFQIGRQASLAACATPSPYQRLLFSQPFSVLYQSPVFLYLQIPVLLWFLLELSRTEQWIFNRFCSFPSQKTAQMFFLR